MGIACGFPRKLWEEGGIDHVSIGIREKGKRVSSRKHLEKPHSYRGSSRLNTALPWGRPRAGVVEIKMHLCEREHGGLEEHNFAEKTGHEGSEEAVWGAEEEVAGEIVDFD